MWTPPPYWKGKGFCPNPIVKFGIPKYADSLLNKKVIGTPDHQKYWEEQLYYIHNGYPAGGGHTIPGRLYYFWNFRKLPTVRGPIYPDICDLHYELANYVEWVKKERLNGLMPKGRRKGISEFFSAGVVDYGYRFSFDYKAGVAAGLDDYAQDFMSKWRYADSLIVPELRLHKLTDNPGEIIAGYEEKDNDNAFNEAGTRNTIYTRTMFNNVNLFKGLYLNDVIVEELGEFKKVRKFISATEACLMAGSIQYGNMWAFGTGGKDTSEFRELYEKAKHYKFVPFFIDGRRFYFPYYGFKGTKGKDEVVSITPNLMDRKPYEREGVEDLAAAEIHIKQELERLAKADDREAYFEFKQNNPLKIADVFATTNVNNFDATKLNDQSSAIASLHHPKYSKYNLNWVKTKEGMIKIPMEVELEPLRTGADESKCVYVLNDIMNVLRDVKKYRNLFVAGIDSYDQDTSKTSKSLGAMCVLIRENMIAGMLKKAPVAVIRTRPPRKEDFYELCLKLSVLFDLKNNALVDVRCPAVIQYFKDRRGEQFLAKRPLKFEKEGSSEQGHDYGISLNTYSKPLMVSIMQTAIVDHCHEIWFNSDLDVGPNLITELQNYDMVAIGSDNDLADAYGIALMQDISCDSRPKDITEDAKDRRFDLPEFGINRDGDLMMMDPSEDMDPEELYGNREEFDDGRW